jgi:hypothetical protein
LPAPRRGPPSSVHAATPHNLHTPIAAARIKQLFPAAKVIAILKEPVWRMSSAYHQFSDNYIWECQKAQPAPWCPIYRYYQLQVPTFAQVLRQDIAYVNAQGAQSKFSMSCIAASVPSASMNCPSCAESCADAARGLSQASCLCNIRCMTARPNCKHLTCLHGMFCQPIRLPSARLFISRQRETNPHLDGLLWLRRHGPLARQARWCSFIVPTLCAQHSTVNVCAYAARVAAPLPTYVCPSSQLRRSRQGPTEDSQRPSAFYR